MSDSDSDFENEESHIASLKRLESKDPEFYKFLKENDEELLKFQEEDDDNDVASDDEKEPLTKDLISKSKLEYLKSNIQVSPTIKLCKALMSAFKNAVQQADSASDKKIDMSHSELFNEIIKLCLVELVPALGKVLKLKIDNNTSLYDPAKSKLWIKMHKPIKSYLIDLLKLLSFLKESSMLTLLLKHAVHMLPYYLKFNPLSRNLLKKVINLWCTKEDTVRVLSLLIIVRTARSLPKETLGKVLKQMYFAYVRNTKFTSVLAWPMINFMKRSLTEIYCMDSELAYEHAFVYIRQMSIHLRNALTTKKKEAFQTVYNWQYMHCIIHWAHLICTLYSNDAIKTLVYPLVQTILGTINLIPTAKYIPLRLHLVRVLINITKETGVFIPILPIILNILTIVDFNKKSTFSLKPLDFSCALKVTKSQLIEAGFKDQCINEVCNLILDYLKIYSHTIGFPELVLPAQLQIKAFIKQCKVAKYNQQLKTLLGKVEENSIFIGEKRRLISFKLVDNASIKEWEDNILSQGTPIIRAHVIKNIKKEDGNTRPKKKQKLS